MENKAITSMNIYEKMSAVSTEIKTVKKNIVVRAGNNSYKAVAEADILKAIRELEAKYRIYSYPSEREIVASDRLTYKNSAGTYESLYMRLKITYAFINIDNPSDMKAMVSYGDGIDQGDKAPGKAMTYADKYALMKAYKIPTGDDPDQEPSGTINEKPSVNNPAPSRSQQTGTKPAKSTSQDTPQQSNYKRVVEQVKATKSPWRIEQINQWIINETGEQMKINSLDENTLQKLLAAIKQSAEEQNQ